VSWRGRGSYRVVVGCFPPGRGTGYSSYFCEGKEKRGGGEKGFPRKNLCEERRPLYLERWVSVSHYVLSGKGNVISNLLFVRKGEKRTVEKKKGPRVEKR